MPKRLVNRLQLAESLAILDSIDEGKIVKATNLEPLEKKLELKLCVSSHN